MRPAKSLGVSPAEASNTPTHIGSWVRLAHMPHQGERDRVRGAGIFMARGGHEGPRPLGGWLFRIGVSFPVFYVLLRKDEMVLLHAYRKRMRKTPPREIEIARRRMWEVLG